MKYQSFGKGSDLLSRYCVCKNKKKQRYLITQAAKKFNYPYKGLTNKELSRAMMNRFTKWLGIATVEKKTRIWFTFKNKEVSLPW